MDKILAVVKFGVDHYVDIFAALSGACVGLAGLFLIIPGEQPEKALQGVANFLAKFSKK